MRMRHPRLMVVLALLPSLAGAQPSWQPGAPAVGRVEILYETVLGMPPCLDQFIFPYQKLVFLDIVTDQGQIFIVVPHWTKLISVLELGDFYNSALDAESTIIPVRMDFCLRRNDNVSACNRSYSFV